VEAALALKPASLAEEELRVQAYSSWTAVFAREAPAGMVDTEDSHVAADKTCPSAADSMGHLRYIIATAALLDVRTWNGARLEVVGAVVVVGEDRHSIHGHRTDLRLLARSR